MTMTFNLMLTLTESQPYLENLVQYQFRSEKLCQDGVVGWGGGCPAGNKDQLLFDMIKIQLRDANLKDNNFNGYCHSTNLAANLKAHGNLDLFSLEF